MLRAVVTLCLLAGLSNAAPEYTRAASAAPELAAAEKVWATAAGEKDRAKAPAAWEAAAMAFIQIVDAGTAAVAVRKEAAHAAVLAWRNALDVDPRSAPAAAPKDFSRVPVPQPLDARDRALLHALEAYLALSPPPDDAAAAKYLRATVLLRRDHLDKAVAGFVDVVDNHRTHEAAEYAANLALDGYNQLQRYDELIALALKLRADPTFLANKPELAKTVRRIHSISMRQGAEAAEKAARASSDLATYDRCGELYLAIVTEPGTVPAQMDEVRYNAAVCFAQGGSVDRAVATFRELIKHHPRSRLATKAFARLALLHGDVARYREAVDALEQYVVRFPAEKDAYYAASDAVLYALAIGDLGRAARIADLAIARYGAKKPEHMAEASLAVLHAQLAAGKRKEAAARARGLTRNAGLHKYGSPALALSAARAFAAAACLVAIPANRSAETEPCPQVRDRALVAAARVQLANAGDRGSRRPPRPSARAVGFGFENADDTARIADHATRLALDLDLEGLLANKKPPPAAVEPVASGYESLIARANVASHARIAARARLGAMHRHLGDRDKALVALRACVTDARATFDGSEWLARCERDLTALNAPDPELLPERLPRPTAAPVIAIERPR